MRPVFFNGKFSAQPTTGVQRVAGQLLQALDDLPATGRPARRWVLLCPPGAAVPGYQRIETRVIGPAGLPLHLWEQAVLPWAARHGRLVNLAGSAPLWPAGQVCTFHDAAVFDHPEAYTAAFVRWYRALFRRQARVAALLLTPSVFSRDRLMAVLGVPEARIAVLPNGGDHLDTVAEDETVLDRHVLRGRPYFLAVGSANATKNQARLLAAFAQLRADPSMRLVLVGGRNDRVFAPGTAGAAAHDARIVRTGSLADAPLKALYRHALALVFPSLYEGFGLPPLEAMACGCPVAAARAAAVPEVCGDAVLYFDPTSQQQLAQAMQTLVDEPALRQRLADAGRVHVRAFRWANSAAMLNAHLESLP